MIWFTRHDEPIIFMMAELSLRNAFIFGSQLILPNQVFWIIPHTGSAPHPDILMRRLRFFLDTDPGTDRIAGTPRERWAGLPILLALVIATIHPAYAQPAAGNGASGTGGDMGFEVGANHRDDASENWVNQDRARQAVANGEIKPLHEVLDFVASRHPGRVLDVRLKDREAGLHGWVYDISLLTPDRRIVILRVDAGTGSILMVDGAENSAEPVP